MLSRLPARALAGPIVLLTAATAACFSVPDVTYTPPAGEVPIQTADTVHRPAADVWATLAATLVAPPFVAGSVDAKGGVITVSDSGDPEQTLDCGHVLALMKGKTGDHTYDYPAARALESWELAIFSKSVTFDRTMALAATATVTVTPLGEDAIVTVMVRYRVIKKLAIHTDSASPPTGKHAPPKVDTVTFETGKSGKFGGDPPPVTCRSTGALERQILALAEAPPQ